MRLRSAQRAARNAIILDILCAFVYIALHSLLTRNTQHATRTCDMNAPQTNTPDITTNHYTIKPDGWVRCAHCTRELKGATQDATLRIIAEHLHAAHGIALYGADASEHVERDSAESRFNTPYFIGPRRNGSCIIRSQRTDYGAWV